MLYMRQQRRRQRLEKFNSKKQSMIMCVCVLVCILSTPCTIVQDYNKNKSSPRAPHSQTHTDTATRNGIELGNSDTC